MKPVIQVSGLSKSYEISHQTDMKASYGTLKDDFSKLLKKPFGASNKESHETFWALKDVSFEVNQGEIFGIIGKNGAGKSTLLKILSRITEPTKGGIKMHGRVASLLEVGTGFHPELTGRENIFFNGSILGMSRQEIRKKFDEIVAFSEIEKFLDTPVKFYSSGMYVRLAFAVAAHLESEILILDEVLAVGDASFQQKSLNKILSTIQEGRTVLFVSHSMDAVRKLCNRGLLLTNGQVGFIGNTEELIDRYLEVMEEEAPDVGFRYEWKNDGSVKNDYFVPKKIYLTDLKGNKITKSVPNNQEHYLVVDAQVKKSDDLLTIGVSVYNSNRTLLYMSYPTDQSSDKWVKMHEGRVQLRAKLPVHLLNAGQYKISLVGGLHNKFWLFEPGSPAPSVDFVINGGLSKSPYWKQPREGLLAPLLDWELESQ